MGTDTVSCTGPDAGARPAQALSYCAGARAVVFAQLPFLGGGIFVGGARRAVV
jgi:hypothetical protein